MNFVSSINCKYTGVAKLLLLLVFSILSFEKLRAEDFEIWTSVGAETEWKNMEFSLGNANFFHPSGDWFLNYTQLSIDFNSNKSISYGLSYKQEYLKFLNQIRIVYRPMFHLYYSKCFGDIEFRDRNRFEFRIFETKMINRYRNQLRLSYDRFKRIQPYLSTEFFFYFNKLNYARQRTLVGFNLSIESISLNLFGGCQNDEVLPKLWNNKYVFGTSLSYSF